MRPATIHVEVTGPTASGKTALVKIIQDELVARGYYAVSPQLDLEMRMGTPTERTGANTPARAREPIVVTIGETNEPRKESK